jgi:hypothetical protein
MEFVEKITFLDEFALVLNLQLKLVHLALYFEISRDDR